MIGKGSGNERNDKKTLRQKIFLRQNLPFLHLVQRQLQAEFRRVREALQPSLWSRGIFQQIDRRCGKKEIFGESKLLACLRIVSRGKKLKVAGEI